MTIPIFIEAFKKEKKVYGEIKIYKERFIHLDAKLRFSKKTNDLEESSKSLKLQNFQTLLDANKETNVNESSNQDYWVDTIFNTVRLNFKYIEELIYSEEEISAEEIIESPNYKYQDLYEIDKDLKLDINKFNVIDHPYFSVLIKVTELVK
jgi:negative regulator of replication initiation